MALSSDSSWLETWALPSWPLRTQPRKLFGGLWILPAGFGVSALAENPGQLRCLLLAWRLVPGARRMCVGGRQWNGRGGETQATGGWRRLWAPGRGEVGAHSFGKRVGKPQSHQGQADLLCTVIMRLISVTNSTHLGSGSSLSQASSEQV